MKVVDRGGVGRQSPTCTTMKLRLIEQSCGCSTVRGGGRRKVSQSISLMTVLDAWCLCRLFLLNSGLFLPAGRLTMSLRPSAAICRYDWTLLT